MAAYNTIITPLQSSPSPKLISSHLHSFPSLLTSSHHLFPTIHTSCNRNARVGVRVRVRVRSGYTKRNMETADAYELIDEESGEKLIVLGDDVDHDSASLLWRRSGKNVSGNGGTQPASSVEDNTSSTAITQRFTGTFGRLKAQKVRTLIKKSEKQVTSGNKYEELDINEADVDDEDEDEDDDHMETSNSRDVFIRGKRNNTNVKTGIEQLVGDQPSRKSFDSVGNSSKAKSSATRSNGWSNGEGKFSSRGEIRDLKDTRSYSANSDFFSRKTFKDLPCSDDIVDSLRAQGFVRPSHIQAMAYVPAIEGKSCIIADQSGSGKTLAYLAPVIQRLRQEEINGISKSAPNSPRAVVIVPTAELASQVLRNCRSISKNGVPFRSMVATGGFRQRTQLESLDQDLDVLIATPGRFMYLTKEGFLRLTNLRCAVLDEVDVLFKDEDFEQALQSLITSSPVTTQYLFATATLPVAIYNKLIEIFPDCEVIMGPGMHRTSSGLEEVLVDCSGKAESEKTPETAFSNKRSALLKLAGESPVPKTIVFCNKIETCRKVENALRRFDRKENRIRVLPFHAALDQEARLANMKEFITLDTHDHSLFLICTDRASRGIDFPNVDHVVLFDFPRDPSEYVRRVGRTARGAGGRGRAFVFVVGKQVSLASRIIDRNQKGHPLHEVPSAYELLR